MRQLNAYIRERGTHSFLMGCLLLAVLFFTNRGLGPWGPFDAQCYLSIAESAPRLPETTMEYHYAQRLAVPYALGMLAHVIPMSIQTMFIVLVYCSIFAIAAAWFALASRLQIEMRLSFLMFALLVFNPYSFRYYLVYPGMVLDLIFVVGVCLVTLGILSTRLWLLYLGIVLAALARQTALLLLPGLVVYWGLVSGRSLLRNFSFAAKWVGGPIVLTGVIYILSSLVAENFSSQSANLKHMSGLITDLQRGISLKVGIDFVGRLVLVFGLPISIGSGFISLERHGARTKIKNISHSERHLLILFGLWIACIGAQPMLAGPSVTTDAVQRLTGLGYIPFLLGMCLVVRRFTDSESWSTELLMLLSAVILAVSLHHTYTFFGEVAEQKSRFAMNYIVGCVVALAAIRLWGYQKKSQARL